jgi:hypothetical protein
MSTQINHLFILNSTIRSVYSYIYLFIYFLVLHRRFADTVVSSGGDYFVVYHAEPGE